MVHLQFPVIDVIGYPEPADGFGDFGIWTADLFDPENFGGYGGIGGVTPELEMYLYSTDYLPNSVKNWVSIWPDEDVLQQELHKLAVADRKMAIAKVTGTALGLGFALSSYYDIATTPKQPIDYQFSGTPVTPGAAFYHFLNGHGAPRQFDLNDMNLKISPTQIPELIKVISELPKAPGTYKIDTNFQRDSAKDNTIAWLTVGNFTMRAVGTVTVNPSGEYSFTGEMRAYNDIYNGGDANSSRSFIGNVLSEFLRTLEALGKGTPYEIALTGSIPLNFSGAR